MRFALIFRVVERRKDFTLEVWEVLMRRDRASETEEGS